MKNKIFGIFILLIFVLSAGFGCKTVDTATQTASEPITITYWGVFDDTDAFTEIIEKYRVIHPNISVEYKKLRFEEYENELLNAWAEDRGPDIFAIQNTWLRKYQTKLVPMPAEITMSYLVETGTIKKEIVPQLKTLPSLTVRELKTNFADVVAGDVIFEDGQIYGLPLSIDTLALYYNRDLFNSAGITEAPKYWNKEFQQDVKKLTKQDPKKGIIQSGVAMGTANNVERYSDILTTLMMQNGAVMTIGPRVTFHSVPETIKTGYNPGLEALRFYSDFANPLKEVYSWNKDLPNSLQAFTSGNLAMFFGYSYHLEQIKALAPTLNFGIAKLPQIEGNPLSVNYANYWVNSVSKKSKHPAEAWDFIQFMTKEENAKIYLEKTKKPTALKSLITSQQGSEDLGVFAEQILSAKSWYKGKSVNDAERAIKEMIEMVLIAPDRLGDIISEGAAKVQQTIN
jgi:multiple sugar transport system substrate-binding protein